VTGNQYKANKIKRKGRPETSAIIGNSTQYQKGKTYIEAVSDQPGIKLHNDF
jgi:hypothetical protein